MINKNLVTSVEPLLVYVIDSLYQQFGNRLVACFKLGSLGEHGDFSLCSDVDVAFFLNEIHPEDEVRVNALWSELKKAPFEFADRLSLFWSSYNNQDFIQGRGRFPALDRLDLIQHGVLIKGQDQRDQLIVPSEKEIIIESAYFIEKFMLTESKHDELLSDNAAILQKGARYFSKCVLFPVRLLFTLDHPNQVASNAEAVKYFNQQTSLPLIVKELVNTAFSLRNAPYMQPVIPTVLSLTPSDLQKALLALYSDCITGYAKAANAFGEKDLSKFLQENYYENFKSHLQ